MRKYLSLALIALCPFSTYAYNIKVDIDVTIMNGDGTINTGDDNESCDERNDCGSERE